MIKKVIRAGFLITAAVLLVGCGITDGKDIGKDKAREIAFTDANVSEENVSRLHVSRDIEDGRKVYEVQFTDAQSGMEYEYEVLASDGTIQKVDKEKSHYVTPQTQQTEMQKESTVQNTSQNQNSVQNEVQNNNNTQRNVAVSLNEAKKKVLNRVQGATGNDMKIELDYDDGHYVYEGEVWYGQHEYDFKIDANTGNFLEWSQELR